MMNDIVYYTVETTTPFDESEYRFVRKKRFRSLPNQIESLVSELACGNFSGVLFMRSNDPPYDVYKKRLPNPDANTGQSNGYRVVYFVQHGRRLVVLLSIYYKKEQESQTETYIQGLIDGLLEPFDD